MGLDQFNMVMGPKVTSNFSVKVNVRVEVSLTNVSRCHYLTTVTRD